MYRTGNIVWFPPEEIVLRALNVNEVRMTVDHRAQGQHLRLLRALLRLAGSRLGHVMSQEEIDRLDLETLC